MDSGPGTRPASAVGPLENRNGTVASREDILEAKVLRLERSLGELMRSMPRRRRPSSDDPVDSELWKKIHLLSENHKKNMNALSRLEKRWASPRSRTTHPPSPHRPEAWAVRNQAPSPKLIKGKDRRARTPATRSSHHNGTHKSFTTSSVNGSSREGWWKREGKQRLTVLTPFRSMENHELKWKRKKREQEERESLEKAEEEMFEKRRRERFVRAVKRGKECHGVIARSKEMMNRRQALEAEAALKEEEDRRRLEFKAVPVYFSDEDWITIQERQAIRRKQRVEMRKIQMRSMSRLPSRMAIHALEAKNKANRRSRSAPGTPRWEEKKADSKRKPIPPEKIGEILVRRQRLWDLQLAAAKRKTPTVVTQTLPMEEREKKYHQISEERARRRATKERKLKEQMEEEERRKRERAFSAPVPSIPRTTHSQMLKNAEVQARLNRSKAEADREVARLAKRKAGEAEISRKLSRAIYEMERKEGRTGRCVEAAARGKARESREKFRRAMKENKARLRQAAENRPTLRERQDMQLRKESAKRAGLAAVAKCLYGGGGGGFGGGQNRWKALISDGSIFDEEERAVLGTPST